MKEVQLEMDSAGGDRLMRVFLVFAIVVNVAVIVALSALWWTSRSHEFQPFRFPEQTVLNRLPGHGDQAAVRINQSIVIKGTKCNTSKRTFGTHGIKVWASIVPPGNSISFSAASGAMHPGCRTQTFVNVVPPTVVAQMEKLLQTRDYVVWQLRGTLTAEAENGSTRTWETEPFYVYPREQSAGS